MSFQSASVSVSFCGLSGFFGFHLEELVRHARDGGVVHEVRRAGARAEVAEVRSRVRRQARRVDRVHAVRVVVPDVVAVVVVLVARVGHRLLGHAGDVPGRRVPGEEAEALLLVVKARVQRVVRRVEVPLRAVRPVVRAAGREVALALDERAGRAVRAIRGPSSTGCSGRAACTRPCPPARRRWASRGTSRCRTPSPGRRWRAGRPPPRSRRSRR